MHAKGKPLTAERLALCDWNVLITNLPAERLTFAEAWSLQRARWQVELLFRLWKSEGGIAELRGQKSCRVLCELLAKLLAMVVQHWLLLVCGGVSLRYSHRRGARRIRRRALWLLWNLNDVVELVHLLQRLQQRLLRLRVVPRIKDPATFQRLEGIPRPPNGMVRLS